MKSVLFFTVMFLSFAFAQAQTTILDSQSVELAKALLQPEVRECIDGALKTNKVFNDTFSINEIEAFTANEPLFPSNPTHMQSVLHYILQANGRASIGGEYTKKIDLKFDVKINSGTGVLSYSCSAQVQ